MTVQPMNGKAKKKKYVTTSNGKTGKIKIKKTAPKGTYQFKVTSTGNTYYKKTEKVISIKVK